MMIGVIEFCLVNQLFFALGVASSSAYAILLVIFVLDAMYVQPISVEVRADSPLISRVSSVADSSHASKTAMKGSAKFLFDEFEIGY